MYHSLADIPCQTYDAIIMDLDGTIYAKPGMVWRMLLRQCGHWRMLMAERQTRRAMRGVYCGGEEAYYARFFASVASRSGQTEAAVREWYFSSYLPDMVRIIQCSYHPRQEVVDILHQAQEAGIAVILYSDYEMVEEKLEALSMDASLFTRRVSAPGLGGLKPAIEGIAGVLSELDIAPERVLWIGDREDTDGASARRLGGEFKKVQKVQNSSKGSKGSKVDQRSVEHIEHIDQRSVERLFVKQIVKMMYIPQMGLTYSPTDPYVRMYHPVYDRECRVDERYPFVDDRWIWRLQRCLLFPLILKGIIYPFLLRVRAGVRVDGREQLRRYRDQLQGGYITIANHAHPHDCEAVMLATGSDRNVRIPMFQKNFQTKHQYLLRLIGGIPIPPEEEGLSALKQFTAAFDTFHKRGYHFHFFPEMAKWPWYAYLRPFKKGAFTMAYKYDMPIVPCVITYRERTGIYRLFAPKEEPLIDVTVLEPIFPNRQAPRKDEVERLLRQSHQAMVEAMGIDDNPWPASMDE